MERAIVKFSIALMITSICAAFLIPAVYKVRGYMDVGGEWILLLGIFAFVCWVDLY